VWENGTGLRCELAAADATSRLVGTSSMSSVKVTAAPAAAVVVRQSVKVGACVLSEDAELPSAEVTDFAVSLNGTVVTTPASAVPIGADPWPTKAAEQLGFGTLYEGPRKEQLAEGDGLRCAGTFRSSPGSPVFDLNVSRAPEGEGLIARERSVALDLQPVGVRRGERLRVPLRHRGSGLRAERVRAEPGAAERLLGDERNGECGRSGRWSRVPRRHFHPRRAV
jgi:hypothetical protein